MNARKILAIILILMMVGGMFMLLSENDTSQASTTGSGTSADPYSFVDINGNVASSTLNGKYVRSGSSVTIREYDDGEDDYAVSNVTANRGLSISNGTLSGTLSGSVGQTVMVTITVENLFTQEQSTILLTFTISEPMPSTYIYTLNFYANGGTGAPASVSLSTPYTTDTLTIPMGTPTRTGCIFAGWSTNSNSYYADYQPGSSYTVSNTNQQATVTVSLYAVWKVQVTYEVSPVGSGEVYGYTEEQVPYGYPYSTSGDMLYWTALSWTMRSAIANPGYVFDHWSVGSSGTITSPTTITAYFIPDIGYHNYSLVYYASPGYGGPPTDTVYNVQALSYTFTVSAIEPTRNNYNFLGWQNPNDPDNLLHGGDSVTVTSTSPTLTLTAVWQNMNTYTFNLVFEIGEDATGGPSDETVTKVGNNSHIWTIPDEIPTRSHYEFLGWTQIPGDNTPTIFPGYFIAVLLSENTYEDTKTLYAVWTYLDVDPATYWSNGEQNGSVSILYKFNTTGQQGVVSNAMLYRYFNDQFRNSGFNITVQIEKESTSGGGYNTKITATLKDADGIMIATGQQSIGQWGAVIVNYDAAESRITCTRVGQFRSFTDYQEMDTTTVLDYQIYYGQSTIHRIGFTPTTTAPMQQVVRTNVFLNTYGAVMTNPAIDIDSYYAEIENARLNFYSFALYGSSMNVNGDIFQVDNGRITIRYAVTPDGNVLSTSETAKTVTLQLQNVSVTWQDGICYLTFENDRFTLNLGSYVNRVVSFGGLWYFSTGIYESRAVEITVFEKDWNDIDFDWTWFLAIALVLMILAGLFMRFKTNASGLDYIIVFGAIGLITVCLGGLIL